MPVSTFALLKEWARQGFNEDSNFLKRMLYFFELRIPAEVGVLGDTDFLFPLILPPESYGLDEPFTVEATPTQGGGLYVEENGIVQRMIRLRGHTGFKPRNLNLPSSLGPVASTLSPEKKSYTRELPVVCIGALSGQRHFQYLQDSVFRTYADLKRDPALSKDTMLIFHNPRDDEHWLVVPQKFSLERDAGSRFLYRYNIELLVVDKAEARDADFSDDKSLFDSIRDAIRSIKNAIDQVSGAINDLTALVGEIKSFIKDIGKIIDAVTNIIDAATNFVNGITDLIQAPFALLESTIEAIEAAVGAVSAAMELGETVTNFPETCMNKFRQMGDALEVLGINPANWESPAEATVRKIREQQESRRSLSLSRKEEALATTPPSTFDEVRNLGTQLTPGDVQSSEGELTVGVGVKQYRSGRQVSIEAGETLVTLAARYMGDGRLWQHIAVMNGLKPPFIDKHAAMPLVAGVGAGSAISGTASGADELPFDGALGVGGKILIPSTQKSSLDMPVLPVQGVKSDEPVENHFLGTDLKLEAVSGIEGSNRAYYDIPIDIDAGSVDALRVEGLANLVQLLQTRLLTERGTDTLYKRLGIRRVVGLGFTAVDLETARFRVTETLAADPRVAAVQSVKLDQDNDQLVVDVMVAVRGLSDKRAVQVRI